MKNKKSYGGSHYDAYALCVYKCGCGSIRVHGKAYIQARKFSLNANNTFTAVFTPFIAVMIRSRFGNTVTRHVYSAATGVHVHDTQTGLRAFHRSLIPRMLEIEGDRYEYEINMLMQLAAEGVPIIEERIETVYEDNNSGSHFRTVRDSFRIYKEILKFSASSLVSFAIDYGMYALLLAVTGAAGIANSLVISNIGARLVSGTANYAMNRKLVFKSRTGFARSAVQYFLLAAFILAGNTIVLSTLAGTLGINRFAAKLITEVIFFAISWTVQKYVIFFKEDSDDTGTERIQKLGTQERQI